MFEVYTTDAEITEDQVEAQKLRAATDEVRERARLLYGEALKLEKYIRTVSLEDVDQTIRELDEVYERLDEIHDQQYEMVAAALQQRHTADEVRAWCERAVAMGANHPRVDATLLEDILYERQVPNTPFRERILALVEAQEHQSCNPESGDPYVPRKNYREAAAVALETDSRHLSRLLGEGTRPADGGRSSLSLFISYESASVIARTLGMTPHEAGI